MLPKGRKGRRHCRGDMGDPEAKDRVLRIPLSRHVGLRCRCQSNRRIIVRVEATRGSCQQIVSINRGFGQVRV
jgi:hypothetical protein